MLSIVEHPIPYNGTIFSLNGIAHLDPSVDTNVTVMGIWSDSEGQQVTTSPPYIFSLEFRPLSGASSKQYTLNVTVLPTDNSPFNVASNLTILPYSLAVQSKCRGSIVAFNFII